MTANGGTTARSRQRTGMRRTARAAIALLLCASCAGPILPARSKPGGSVKWAEMLAVSHAVGWARDATLVRVGGTGVGTDGWLPDRGGEWQFTFTSVTEKLRLEVIIDSDGKLRDRIVALGPPPETIPPGWIDSPKVWAAARARWSREPVHTLEAELALGLEPERAPGQLVWRLRFWLPDSRVETHVVTASGRWLAMY